MRIDLLSGAPSFFEVVTFLVFGGRKVGLFPFSTWTSCLIFREWDTYFPLHIDFVENAFTSPLWLLTFMNLVTEFAYRRRKISIVSTHSKAVFDPQVLLVCWRSLVDDATYIKWNMVFDTLGNMLSCSRHFNGFNCNINRYITVPLNNVCTFLKIVGVITCG